MTDLLTKSCVPCDGNTPKLDAATIARLAIGVPVWTTAGERLHRRFVFPDFAHAMRFVNHMAALAEAEGHHPDFAVHYREVDVTIWTHAAGGLTENDFILAAKIDAL
jgi:4a-hydroxytetrahydrobiopterin dehydratase